MPLVKRKWRMSPPSQQVPSLFSPERPMSPRTPAPYSSNRIRFTKFAVREESLWLDRQDVLGSKDEMGVESANRAGRFWEPRRNAGGTGNAGGLQTAHSRPIRVDRCEGADLALSPHDKSRRIRVRKEVEALNSAHWARPRRPPRGPASPGSAPLAKAGALGRLGPIINDILSPGATFQQRRL
jgi:hypothetical protein